MNLLFNLNLEIPGIMHQYLHSSYKTVQKKSPWELNKLVGCGLTSN